MPRGIFRLKQVYEEQLSGEWSTKGDVWLSPSPFTAAHPFGYFGGGLPVPDGAATVDRIDYSNDTVIASRRGSLSVGRGSIGATGNSNFGYFAGGIPAPGAYSTVDRIDYSNDTATATAKGPLSSARYSMAATGNSNFGYFAGGNTPGGSGFTTVERIDYGNDTAEASPKGPLSSARFDFTATGNTSFGYFGGGRGGYPGPLYSIVDRIDYSNDTATASPKGPLSVARHGLGATGNADFGYFGAGKSPTVSTVDRIDYSSDTGTTPSKGPLSAAGYNVGATGNSSFGYFASGFSRTTIVDRIDYSNDTATASERGNISYRPRCGASSSQANAITTSTFFPASSVRENVAPQGTDFGYFGGGEPGPLSSVDRVDYSNDTATAVTKGPLSVEIGRAHV